MASCSAAATWASTCAPGLHPCLVEQRGGHTEIFVNSVIRCIQCSSCCALCCAVVPEKHSATAQVPPEKMARVQKSVIAACNVL